MWGGASCSSETQRAHLIVSCLNAAIRQETLKGLESLCMCMKLMFPVRPRTHRPMLCITSASETSAVPSAVHLAFWANTVKSCLFSHCTDFKVCVWMCRGRKWACSSLRMRMWRYSCTFSWNTMSTVKHFFKCTNRRRSAAGWATEKPTTVVFSGTYQCQFTVDPLQLNRVKCKYTDWPDFSEKWGVLNALIATDSKLRCM